MLGKILSGWSVHEPEEVHSERSRSLFPHCRLGMGMFSVSRRVSTTVLRRNLDIGPDYPN